MKFIIASLFVIAAVHALPINNLQVELTPVEIAATYTADANAALKSCQGWFDSVCSDSLKKITNKFASQKITDCNSVDLEAAALAQKRLSTCAKRWLVSSCKEDVEGLVQDMITLGANRVRAKAEAEKAVVRTAGVAWRFAAKRVVFWHVCSRWNCCGPAIRSLSRKLERWPLWMRCAGCRTGCLQSVAD
jgi:hypothetical protein